MRKFHGSLEYIEPFEKAREKKGAQGSLEYIIIIGGIIILAAATYFMLKGFSQTSTGETTESIETAGAKFQLEVENPGRSETRFLAKKWGDYPYVSKLTLNNSGEQTTAQISPNNLSFYNLNLSQLQFAQNSSGQIISLSHTLMAHLRGDNLLSQPSHRVLFRVQSHAYNFSP